ncbi:MAG: SMEK domain-containing protein, partial [Bacteroidota bacterium]
MNIRNNLINSISQKLAILQTHVELNNSLSLYDLNIYAEDFYRVLLNKVYGYNLINVNVVKKHAIAIDLLDADSKIAIQVTADNSKNKIVDTITKYTSSNNYQGSNSLKILIIKPKIKRKGIISVSDYNFDLSNDILDVTEILAHLKNSKNVTQLEQIDNWLTD